MLEVQQLRRPAWIPPAAGLLLAAVLVGFLARPHGPLTALKAFALASERLLYALAFSIACSYVLDVKWREGSGGTESILELAACAVWLAPLAVCRLTRPMLMTAAAVGFAIGAARLFSHRTAAPADSGEPAGVPVAGLVAACVIEAGAIAVVLNEPSAGACLLGLAAAIIVWRLTRARELPSEPRDPGEIRLAWHTMFAFLITLIGLSVLIPGHAGDFPFGFGGGGDASEPVLPALEPAGPRGDREYEGDVFRGVILWPELKPYTVLVPPLPSLPSNLFDKPGARPLSIPFFGVYWYYREPDRMPPKSSYVVHGNPARMSFRSTDYRPLIMEAHQNLGKIIDMACCRGIEVELISADRYPPSVFLELLLFDTRSPGLPPESLGRKLVVADAVQTLSFPIPEAGALHQFDEIAMRFHLRPRRSQHSARMSIERFVLVPKSR